MIRPFELKFYIQTLEALYGNLNNDVQAIKELLYEQFAIIVDDASITNIISPKVVIDSTLEEDAYLIYAHCM